MGRAGTRKNRRELALICVVFDCGGWHGVFCLVTLLIEDWEKKK